MSLSRLFRVLATLLALASAALVARVAWVEWHTLQRAGISLNAVGQLKLALQAAEMVSRERGPTNAVLGDASPARPERRAALAQARARTDHAFDALQTVLASAPEAPDADAARHLAAARAALAEARAVVERTAALPRDQRAPAAIRSAVYAMVGVVPLLAPIVGALANEAQQAYPALSDDVQAARLTAELREYAGLLGSHFTAALARRQPFSTEERAAIERTRGRIEELRFLVELRVQVPGQADSVRQAWASVEEHYFETAAKLLARVIAAGESDGRYELDPAAFAVLYVPDMNTMFLLRDALLDEAGGRAATERDRAWRTLAIVATGASALLAVLTSAIVIVHRRLLRPLAETTRALKALARDELELQLPRPAADDEIAAVIGAVRTLQEQTHVRLALERERADLIERLREQSNTDFLTGLPNRRAFLAEAARDLAQARRQAFGVVVILLDVDRFKEFNDSLGHAAGDHALTAVAHAIRKELRQGDLVARFGGEEFVLLLNHCDRERGLGLAERLREVIAATPLIDPSGAWFTSPPVWASPIRRTAI
jgi:diguanylate cyclase (GGDEF)-like protein